MGFANNSGTRTGHCPKNPFRQDVKLSPKSPESTSNTSKMTDSSEHLGNSTKAPGVIVVPQGAEAAGTARGEKHLHPTQVNRELPCPKASNSENTKNLKLKKQRSRRLDKPIALVRTQHTQSCSWSSSTSTSGDIILLYAVSKAEMSKMATQTHLDGQVAGAAVKLTSGGLFAWCALSVRAPGVAWLQCRGSWQDDNHAEWTA